MSQALARLGTAVRERREELDLTQQEAARLANVSDTTWHTAEHGKANVALRSLKGIERALNWAPGSAKRILEGGDPIEGSPGPPYRVNVIRHPDTAPVPDDSAVTVQERDEQPILPPEWKERFEKLEADVAELKAELAHREQTESQGKKPWRRIKPNLDDPDEAEIWAFTRLPKDMRRQAIWEVRAAKAERTPEPPPERRKTG